MELDATLNTDGSGLWSERAAAVKITAFEVEHGELRVVFDRDTWNVWKDGLIYTDNRFLAELRALLEEILPITTEEANDVYYSEQGMQDEDYVSLDIGEKFAAAVLPWFPEAVTPEFDYDN